MSELARSQNQETFVLNLGPQHPATHGVVRVKLEMDGEYIAKSEPVYAVIVLGHPAEQYQRLAGRRKVTPRYCNPPMGEKS